MQEYDYHLLEIIAEKSEHVYHNEKQSMDNLFNRSIQWKHGLSKERDLSEMNIEGWRRNSRSCNVGIFILKRDATVLKVAYKR